jgi:ABC-type bacteriocin/lantibiotic exporter with double-glycine peptidase domain
VFKSIFGLVVTWLQARFSAGVALHITRNQFDKYYRLSFHDFSNVKSAVIINHIQRNTSSYAIWILTPLITIFSELLIIVLITAGIAWYNFTLFTFILLTVAPATYIIYYSIRNKNALIGKGIDEAYPKSLITLNHAILGYIDIKLAGKENYYREKFMEHERTFQKLYLSSTFLNMVPMRGYEVVAVLGVVVIFLYSMIFSESHDKVIVQVGLFAMAAFRMMPSLNRLVQSMIYIKKNQVAIDNLNYMSDAVPELTNGEQVPIEFNKSLRFENLSFRFPDSEKNVLDRINFEVKKGEKIGIVGSSGSGKTTLMNVFLRFYKENEGGIFVDGKKLSNEHTKHWRSLIGYVKQDIFLLDGSIKENVMFGETTEDYDQLRLAVQQASMKELVENLPNGWDTQIGEKGSKLSGGQRQRIGIARSLYRKAEILIFDEATSALDSETEAEVTEAIDRLSDSNKTIFIIAHRVTTLRNCDRIYELKEGKIKGVFSYQELLEKII